MSGGNFLSNDVGKSSTLEAMYKALLMGSSDDASSSFGNFGFSSDEEEAVVTSVPTEPSVRLPSLNQAKEGPTRVSDVAVRPPRLSVQKVEPIESKDQRDESSSEDYDDEDDDDEDDDESGEESEPEDDYDEPDNATDTLKVQVVYVEGNVDNPVSNDDVDIVQPPDVISDQELDAILDLDDEITPVEPTVPVESPAALSEEADIDPNATLLETPRVSYIVHPAAHVTSPSTAATNEIPVQDTAPKAESEDNDGYFARDIEANHKIVNGIPVNVDSADEESITSSEEERTRKPEEQTVISNPKLSNGGDQKLHRGQPDPNDPARTPAKQAYEWHKGLRNDTSYRCCVLCLVLFFIVAVAAFIIALVAVTDRCVCKGTDLLRSQLLTLMEERNCPVGWRIYNGSCYGMVGNTVKSHNFAQIACHHYGADLVSLETDAENDFFSKNILCPRYSYLQRDHPVYIGLKKVNVGNITHKIYTYTWSSNEDYSFRNSLNTTNSSKLCVQVTKSGRWTEVDCSTQIHFYCELKLFKNPTC